MEDLVVEAADGQCFDDLFELSFLEVRRILVILKRDRLHVAELPV
jgi:hypothetical protein